MKLNFYVTISMVVGANQLSLFMKHQSVGTHTSQINNGGNGRGDLMFAIMQNYTQRLMAKRRKLNQICSSKTCGKCDKLMTKMRARTFTASLFNFCSIVVNSPNCCSNHLMYSGF